MGNNKMLSLILGAGWAICEVLNVIPSVKSNSVFELISNTLQTLVSSDKS